LDQSTAFESTSTNQKSKAASNSNSSSIIDNSNSNGSTIEFTSPEAKQLLYHLAVERTNIDLYLIAKVESDAQENAIQQFLQQECDGVLQSASLNNNGTSVMQEQGSTSSRFAGVNPFVCYYYHFLLNCDCNQFESYSHYNNTTIETAILRNTYR